MESLREFYKIGHGPSSSHTMGPATAAQSVLAKHPEASRYVVDLFGSLSDTGKGHMTDYAIISVLGEKCTVNFNNTSLPFHANGMIFHVYDGDEEIDTLTAYSVGGGSVVWDGESTVTLPQPDMYKEKDLTDIIDTLNKRNISFFDYVMEHEGEDFQMYLYNIIDTMFDCIERGISKEGLIPGRLKLPRVAKKMYQQAINLPAGSERERLIISSFAYAVAEENASGNIIVTAPTCGSSGVVPAVLYYCYKVLRVNKTELIKALAVAGVIGNVIKTNASISGAAAGCQAEIGSACAMAAAAYALVLGLNNTLIEYAAEMGLEHNLGLTCDPVGGYVQIPCIERNGYAALRSMDAAIYAKQLGYLRKNYVTFDQVVKVMKETGHDLCAAYKETSLGGLALQFNFEDNE